MANRPALPAQKDLKKVCKAVFDGGGDEVRIEVAGMVITASKRTFEQVIENPLDHWRRANG